MPKINVYDAQTNLTQLIERALAGEDVIVARDGRALVRLVPVDGGLRPVGLHVAALSDAEADEAMRPLGESERALWEGDITPPEER
ncbi:MAG: hypothetical protein U5L04_08570 [Trueperaceae bacterium]|nr:hypothetical protein [Trueperaceae bacterium]